MKETPIIMSGNHPRLILDELKTMTRRTWGLEGINQDPDKYKLYAAQESLQRFYTFFNRQDEPLKFAKCPYGQVGQRLWVKETWETEQRYDDLKPSELPEDARILYLADGAVRTNLGIFYPTEIPTWFGKIRPSLFMPRWASRITLEITSLKAERLQEITLPDIVLEGVDIPSEYRGITNPTGKFYAIRQLFEDLWDSLNAKRGHPWDNNDWIWVIGFRMVK